MDDILFAHHRAAHLTDYVTYRLADRHNTRPIAEEVAAYAERYEYAQNILAIHNMSGSKEVVARLAITRRDLRSLEASTDAYITASKNYATVDEIEQWMVDTAFMQPSIVLAWRYLATLQNKLRRSLSFDQPVGEQSTLGDIVGQTDSNLAAVEYDGNETDSSDAQKQALILSKLANLDIVDQAAVLAAFDLHDLMNRDMLLQELDDISILCQKLGVTDPTSLAFYVQARVLPKIRED